MKKHLLLSILLLSATLTTLATTITVGPGGPPYDYATIQEAIDAASDGDDILVMVAGTYAGVVFNEGIAVTVTNSSGGTVTIQGASPALTVSSGIVTYTGIIFTTATNDPAILVNGGKLILRNCTIQESTGFNQTGILVSGAGDLDAGLAGPHGENTFVISGTGVALTNNSSGTVTAIGNYWGGIDYELVTSLNVNNPSYIPWCNSDFSTCYDITTPGPVTYAPKEIKTPGTTITIPVTVDNLSNVSGISLVLDFDVNRLTFVSATLGPGVPPAGNFLALDSALSGRLKISYIAPMGPPEVPIGTLGNGSTLFNLTFDYKAIGGTSPLLWKSYDQGASLEYAQGFSHVPYLDDPTGTYYKDGFVTDMSLSFTRAYAPAQTITAVVAGGTGPGTYTYDWDGPAGFSGDGTSTITPAAIPGSYGTYTLTVTDGLGAQITGTYYYGPVHNTDTKFDFATIQGAINAASNGNIILVDPGDYFGHIVLDRPLDIRGANYGTDPCSTGRSAESILYPDFSNPSPGNYTDPANSIMYVTLAGSGSQIDGFTFDGDNPTLSSSFVVNGHQVDAAQGVNAIDGIASLEIYHNIFRYIGNLGIMLSDYNYPPNQGPTGGNIIRYNKIEWIDPDNLSDGWSLGIGLGNNAYADIRDNCMDMVRVGIQSGGFYRPNPSGLSPKIWDNTITSTEYGIVYYGTHFGPNNPTNFDYSNNHLFTVTGATENIGICLRFIQHSEGATISGNEINGASKGIELYNDFTSSTLTVTGGTISDCGIGIWATNYDPVFPAYSVTSSSYKVDGTTISNSSIAGISVNDSPLNTSGATVSLEITNTSIDGSSAATGILVSGPDAFANIHDNTATVTGTLIGLDINGGTVDPLYLNKFDLNGTGVLIRNNGNLGSSTYNTITNNSNGGIILETGTVAEIEYNTISGNGYAPLADPVYGIGLWNKTLSTVDASPNYWGAADGPYNSPYYTCGSGNAVIGKVTFIPWSIDNTSWSTTTGTALNVNNISKSPPAFYCKIQDGVNDAADNEYIEVATGTYFENVTIDVLGLTLKNAPAAVPVIDAGGNTGDIGVTITANNITLDGFTVQNSGLSGVEGGIVLQGVTGCDIRNNTITDNFAGIALVACSANTIEVNDLTLNYFGIYLGDGTYPSTGNTVSDNDISTTIAVYVPAIDGFTGDGVYVDQDCDGNIFTGNKSHDNGQNGFYFWKTGGQDMNGNQIYANAASGIEMFGSSSNMVHLSNAITGNADGIKIRYSDPSYPSTGNVIENNNISGNTNYGVYAEVDVVSVDASPNWWGYPTGPIHATNPCGQGNAVSDYVTFSPWYYGSGMTTLNGLPALTMTPIPDISTVTATPVIFAVGVSYPTGISNYDANVKTDARITSGTAFPAGSEVISIKYNGSEVLPAPYLLTGTQVYLSDMLGGANPLAGHNGLTVNWEVTVDGFDSPASYAITLDAVSYIGIKTACNNVLATKDFTITFADATFAVNPDSYSACYPDKLVFSAVIGYPAIVNVDTDVKTDAYITSTYTFPAGTKITWGYDGPAVNVYTLPSATGTIYLSTIVAGGVPQPLQGNSGTDTWNFEISNYMASPATVPFDFTIDVQPRARLDGSDYDYTAGDDIALHVLNCSFSGTVSYFNVANTRMNNVTIELYQAGSKVYPLAGEAEVKTDGAGLYTFPKIGAGTYDLVFTTAKPTGSINATDAAQVNQWWTSPYNIEKVRFFAGDVSGQQQPVFPYAILVNNLLNASDAQRIQGKFVQGTPFDREPWTFWRAGETYPTNPFPALGLGYVYPQVTISSGSPVQTGIDFYGLVTGDFNRSFTPGSLKAGESHIEMLYDETILAEAGSEFVLPVYTVNPVYIGAVSLILNFPADLVEVTGVTMDYPGMLDWAVTGNELRIGWNTQMPVSLAAGDQLLALHVRGTDGFTNGKEIRFTLANDILNELADDYYEAIPLAVLSMPAAGSSTFGIGDTPVVEEMSLSARPNPLRDYTAITYGLPFEGRVTLTVYDILGTRMAALFDSRQTAGNYTFDYHASTLPSGVYFVTLKLQGERQDLVRTIKIVKN